MSPVLPARCLDASPGETCRLRIAFFRERKTGPMFPLAVLQCAVHRKASTLYPPGHFPYGRATIVPVDPQGEILVLRSDSSPCSSAPAWETTIFGAAVDAAQGSLWPKAVDPGRAASSPAPQDSRRRTTQGRHLDLAADLLGVGAALDDVSREAIARTLTIPCLELRQAAAEFESVVEYRDQARVLVRVLALLHPVRGLIDQVLEAGRIAGLWGQPRRWDPGGREIRPSRSSAAWS